MKIFRHDDTLRVDGVNELAAANAIAFRGAIEAALSPTVNQVLLDLSRTEFVDCGGLGALIAVRNRLRRHNSQAALRLVNPSRSVQRIIHLTRLDHIFPIDTVSNDTQPQTPEPCAELDTPSLSQQGPPLKLAA